MTAPQPGQPVVFRNATVLTMDDAHTVLNNADVLVSGETIAAVGPNLEVPEGTAEIDAAGGIVMPGMIDTHRHMWQTAMRGYGADWTLTQYFVYYYLTWGKYFRPQDVYAGNLLAAIESIDSGVTTTVDWSHGLRTTDHAEAAADALEEVPGRFVLAYGNIFAGRVGVGHRAGVPRLLHPPVRRQGRHARRSRSPSTCPASRASRRRPRSRWRATSASR